jgi:hypothetical protein
MLTDVFLRDLRLTTPRIPAIVVAVVVGMVVGFPRASVGQGWTRVGIADGIEISRRTVPDTGLVAMRGVGMIEAPVWKIAAILLDSARAPEWVDSLRESRVVRQLGPTAYIEYNHFAMPFLMTDREFVSEVQIDVDPATRRVAFVYRPTRETVALGPHTVRGEILAGRFEARSLELGRRTELLAEVQCDPKIPLPAWLVNLFQRHWTTSTFEGMRKQAARADIKIPDEAFENVLDVARGF